MTHSNRLIERVEVSYSHGNLLSSELKPARGLTSCVTDKKPDSSVSDGSAVPAFVAAFTSFSDVIGLCLSYYVSIAPSAAIVLTATAFFMIAFV